jgi:hypothetical protein
MKLLPQSEWRAQLITQGGQVVGVAIAAHQNKGFLHWTKVELVEPLKDAGRK